jgi:RNase H-fold protein (predicted Holliday junction resolvase)
MSHVVLAVDPGREKCGLAVVDGPAVLARAVTAPGDLGAIVRSWKQEFAIAEILVGNRTSAEEVSAVLRGELPDVPMSLVDESGTTLEARRLYFAEHPPRGWRRLLPAGLQVPPEPYDDYAAVAVARRRLAQRLPGSLHGASRKKEESP